MGESYSEWLVKRDTPILFTILKGITVGGTALFLFAGLLMHIVFLVPALLFFAAAYFVRQHCDLEFEYMLLNNELSVDKIINKEKRKPVVTFQMEKLELLAPTGSQELDGYLNQKGKKMDFSSGKGDKKTYTMIYKGENEQLFVILEPNKEILEGMRMFGPRKVMI